MAQTQNAAIAVVGIDIGKNSFHIVGHASVARLCCVNGRVARSRPAFPTCRRAWSAWKPASCASLSRKLNSLGHNARLMPASVRPYSRGQKNDFRDAEAIAEAVQRPTMKFVATKTAEQLDLQRFTAYGSAWSASAPALSIKFAPSCWSAALRAATTVPARRVAAHPGHATRCPVASHGAHHRRPGAVRAGSMSQSRVCRTRSNHRAPGCRLRTVDERAPYRADHLQRDGGRNRRRRCVHQAALLPPGSGSFPNRSRPATAPFSAAIQAWQSLPAGSVRAGGVGRADQAEDLGAPWAQPWIEAARKRLHHNVLAIALANKLAGIAWRSCPWWVFQARKIDQGQRTNPLDSYLRQRQQRPKNEESART